MFNHEQLERSNFLTWINGATREEIIDALRNHREKLRDLLDKYGDEIEYDIPVHRTSNNMGHHYVSSEH